MYKLIFSYRHAGFLLLVLLMMGFMGCVSTETGPGIEPAMEQQAPEPKQADKEVSMPPKESAVSETQLPDPSKPAHLGQARLDLSAVLQGVFYRLQGLKGGATGTVFFDPQIKPLERAIDMDLSRFALRQISVRKDEAPGEDPFHRRMQAVYKLEDSIGRQLFLIVAADYLIGDNVIYVRQAAAVPHYPEYSDIRFMVSPGNRLPSLKFLKNLPFEELFTLAAENALSIEELKAIKPGSKVACKLMAFNMARIQASQVLNIYTSKDAGPGKTEVRESVSLNKNGWSVAVADGLFEFNSDPGFWFYVGLEDKYGWEKTRLLSRFSSVVKD